MDTLVFTYPNLLWGLLATSLPLLIHLINRHRARRHRFAAMDFLVRVHRRAARQILLRHVLLLVCRTLLIAALVLAAAGPTLRSARSLTPQKAATSVLVIDRSLSMRASTGKASFFSLAQERGRALVRQLPPGDRACLLGAGSQAQPLVSPCTDSKRTLLDAIDALQAEHGGSNLTEAIERAAELLRDIEPERDRRVILLTDAAAHAFRGAPSIRDAPPGIVLENVAPDAPRFNHAIEQVATNPSAQHLELQVRVRSFGEEPETGLPIEVLLEQRRAVWGFVDLAARGTTGKVFNLPPGQVADGVGTVRLKADALAEDDRRPFYVDSRNLVRVLLINGDMRPVLQQDELFYLEHALAPAGEGVSGISFTTLTPDRFMRSSLGEAEVIFLVNVQDLPKETIAALRSFVAAGGGLFLALGNRVDVDRTNQLLDDLLPWPLRDVVALGPPDPDGEHRQGLGFSELDLKHPIFSVFQGSEAEALQNVRTWRAAVLEPGQAGSRARVLARYANGAPALVEGTYLKGRILLWTSTLDRDWGSWPARASFLPFLQQTTLYLAGRLGRPAPPEVTVGAPVSIPLPQAAGSVIVRRPDGVEAELGVPERQGEAVIFRDTALPGWYAVTARVGGEPSQAGLLPGFIVHPPLAESNLTTVEASKLQTDWGSATPIAEGVVGIGGMRSQLLVLLLLAAGLVLIEALLVRR